MTIPPAPPDPIPDPSPPSRPDPAVPPVPPPDIPDPAMPRPVDHTTASHAANVEDDHVSDPAHDDEEGNDWSAEGGATDEGPATAVEHEQARP
ncbi:MAG: hypothetical protein NVSMB48_04760 [Marmoricola sp.]